MKVIVLSLINICLSNIYETNILWNKIERPEWAGNIKFEYNDNKLLSIEGILLPVNTGDRPSHNPNPLNNKCMVGKEYNLDRGHVMALNNGGPHINYNIVPQKSKWQRNGNWRKLEEEIKKITMNEYKWNKTKSIYEIHNITKPKNLVKWKINLYYKNYCSLEYCDCEPYKYTGNIYTKDIKYKFDIISGRNYLLTPIIEEENIKEEDYIYIYFIIFSFVILFIIIYLICKKNKRIKDINFMEFEMI